MSQTTTQDFEIAGLGIKYTLETTEQGNMVRISEEYFNKILEALNDNEQHINNVESHLIDELKKIALIRNIVMSE